MVHAPHCILTLLYYSLFIKLHRKYMSLLTVASHKKLNNSLKGP